MDVQRSGDWLSFGYTSGANIGVAVNPVTGESIASPVAPVANAKLHYWAGVGWIASKTGTAGTDGVYLWNGSVWDKKITGSAGLNNTGKLFFDELGRAFIASSASSGLKELDKDFNMTLRIASPGAASTLMYVYGSGGVLFYSSEGKLSFYREGVDVGTVTLTGTPGLVCFYDSTNSRLLFMNASSGQIATNSKTAPDFPTVEQAIVEIMEVLI